MASSDPPTLCNEGRGFYLAVRNPLWAEKQAEPFSLLFFALFLFFFFCGSFFQEISLFCAIGRYNGRDFVLDWPWFLSPFSWVSESLTGMSYIRTFFSPSYTSCSLRDFLLFSGVTFLLAHHDGRFFCILYTVEGTLFPGVFAAPASPLVFFSSPAFSFVLFFPLRPRPYLFGAWLVLVFGIAVVQSLVS